MSRIDSLRKELGKSVANSLESFQYVSKTDTVEKKELEHTEVIKVVVDAKYSPYLSVSFFYGVRFKKISEINQRNGEADGYYHIFAWSLNIYKGEAVDKFGMVEWTADFHKNPLQITPEIVEAIKTHACPFFEKYRSLHVAHDAIVNNAIDIHPVIDPEPFKMALGEPGHNEI